MSAHPMLTAVEAYAIASEWGSYLNSSDPGACFYSFYINDARPQDETHRALCLAYIDGHCLRQVLLEYLSARHFGNRRCTHEAIKDWRSLVMLRRFLVATECRPAVRRWARPVASHHAAA